MRQNLLIELISVDHKPFGFGFTLWDSEGENLAPIADCCVPVGFEGVKDLVDG